MLNCLNVLKNYWMENKSLWSTGGLILGFLLGAGVFIHKQETDFDCVEDYKGKIVVEVIGIGEYVVSNGCDYSTVSFPEIYSYSVGDTIGKKTFEQKVDRYTQKLLDELEAEIYFAKSRRKLDSLKEIKDHE